MSLGIMASGVIAPVFKAYLGSGVSSASSTTVTITTTAPIDIGDLVAVRVATDNLTATTPTYTCADGGNTYTTHVQLRVNATAALGVGGAIMCSRATVARPTGSTITITLSGAVVAKAAYAETFLDTLNTVRSTAVSASGTATTAAAPASGTVDKDDLVLACVAIESNAVVTGDADTTSGPWSAIRSVVSAAGGTADTRVEVTGQYKIPTAAGAQSFSQTAPVSTEWVALVVPLQRAVS